MDGKTCIRIFNKRIHEESISLKKELIPMISDYLTENNIENSDLIINLIVQNPQLANFTFPKLIDYYRKKYNIFTLYYFNKPILYYE